jgi:hypothetical protein
MHEKLTALVQNAATYSDKAHQVMPSQFSAFGIGIGSRYGKCDEIIEMLQFCQAAAGASVAHYVKEVNFDSKACVCSFELDKAVVEGGEVERALFAIAKRTFTHFYWFDEEIIDAGQSE